MSIIRWKANGKRTKDVHPQRHPFGKSSHRLPLGGGAPLQLLGVRFTPGEGGGGSGAVLRASVCESKVRRSLALEEASDAILDPGGQASFSPHSGDDFESLCFGDPGVAASVAACST